MASRPGVGDPAPDFSLPGTPGGRSYRLDDQRGHPVVLVFYPADNTPVCTTQLRHYSTELEQFAGLGAAVFALSPQDVASHEKFAADNDVDFPLLADVDKAVGRSYGVVGPLGFYKRSVFVIDAAGLIRYAHRSMHNLTFRTTDELVKVIGSAL
ncbi:MAG: peroxiredoxin [Acidimicrobiales bacterium]